MPVTPFTKGRNFAGNFAPVPQAKTNVLTDVLKSELFSIAVKKVTADSTSALAQLQAAGAARESAALRALILKQNEQAKRIAAEEAIKRGALASDAIRTSTAQLIGEQRAALAANGVVVDQDTALDLVAETQGFGTLDALTALDNAEREAAGMVRDAELMRTEARLEEAAAKESQRAGKAAVRRTILGSVGEVANVFASFSRGGA